MNHAEYKQPGMWVIKFSDMAICIMCTLRPPNES